MRKMLSALALGLVLSLAGTWNFGAVAGPPDKEPDTTLNDHPSGKDKNEEPGRSGTQGKSTSDPDGEANGGADKPGGDGGFDADQDGNNGCGNDDDFEDDNNGNCGGRRVEAASTTTDVDASEDTRVLGVTFERPAVPAVAAETSLPTAVAGTTAVRSTGTLAATGAETLPLIAVALQLLCIGGLLRRVA